MDISNTRNNIFAIERGLHRLTYTCDKNLRGNLFPANHFYSHRCSNQKHGDSLAIFYKTRCILEDIFFRNNQHRMLKHTNYFDGQNWSATTKQIQNVICFHLKWKKEAFKRNVYCTYISF